MRVRALLLTFLHLTCLGLQLAGAVLSSHVIPLLLVVLLPQLLMNVASLTWLFRTMSFRGRRAGQAVCVLVHAAQLGPVWRMLKLAVMPDAKDAGELRLLLLAVGVVREGVTVVLYCTWLLMYESTTVLKVLILATAFVNLCLTHTGPSLIIYQSTDNRDSPSPVWYRTARITVDVMAKTLLVASRCAALTCLTYTVKWWVLLALLVHTVLYQIAGVVLDHKLRVEPDQRRKRILARVMSVFDSVTLHSRIKWAWMLYHVIVAMESVAMLAVWHLRRDVTLAYVVLVVVTFSSFVTGSALHYVKFKCFDDLEKPILDSVESRTSSDRQPKNSNNNNVELELSVVQNPACDLTSEQTSVQTNLPSGEYTHGYINQSMTTEDYSPTTQEHHVDITALDLCTDSELSPTGITSLLGGSEPVLNNKHLSDPDLHHIHDSSGYFSRTGNSFGSLEEDGEIKANRWKNRQNDVESLSTIDLFVPQVQDLTKDVTADREDENTSIVPSVPSPGLDSCYLETESQQHGLDSETSSQHITSPEKARFLSHVMSPAAYSHKRTPAVTRWASRHPGRATRVRSPSSFTSAISGSSADYLHSHCHSCSASTHHEDTCSRSFCDLCDYVTIDSRSSDDTESLTDFDGAPDMTLTWPVGRRLAKEMLECLPHGRLSTQEQVRQWLRDITKPEECLEDMDDVIPFTSNMLNYPTLPGQLRRNSYDEANCKDPASVINWTTLNMSGADLSKGRKWFPQSSRSHMKDLLLGLCSTQSKFLSGRFSHRRNTIAHLRPQQKKSKATSAGNRTSTAATSTKDSARRFNTQIGVESTV